jgi:hypothetical protein
MPQTLNEFFDEIADMTRTMIEGKDGLITAIYAELPNEKKALIAVPGFPTGRNNAAKRLEFFALGLKLGQNVIKNVIPLKVGTTFDSWRVQSPPGVDKENLPEWRAAQPESLGDVSGRGECIMIMVTDLDGHHICGMLNYERDANNLMLPADEAQIFDNFEDYLTDALLQGWAGEKLT